MDMSEIFGRLGIAPALDGDEDQMALDTVRALWPEAEPQELRSSPGAYLDARAAKNCHETCGGLLEGCLRRGYVPRIRRLDTPPYGISYDVAYAPCQFLTAREEQRRLSGAVRSSRIPARFSRCTFEGYTTDGRPASIGAAKAAAMRAIDTGEGLALCGPRGTGKSHLAAAMVGEALRRGQPAAFACVPDLLDDMRRSGADDGGAMDVVKGLPFLALDDLGQQRTTEWAGERLYMLINYRYANELQTVITTNAGNPRELAEKLGDHGEYIASRLFEMCRWVALQGPDCRMANRGNACRTLSA
jgi:DNA replication protein DnaC